VPVRGCLSVCLCCFFSIVFSLYPSLPFSFSAIQTMGQKIPYVVLFRINDFTSALILLTLKALISRVLNKKKQNRAELL
jgi:hypothetical protein